MALFLNDPTAALRLLPAVLAAGGAAVALYQFIFQERYDPRREPSFPGKRVLGGRSKKTTL
eukprot:jgi/Chlat1/3459/Chrsp23S03832